MAASPEDARAIPAALTAAIEELLALDSEFCFYFSGFGWFDELCAREVHRLKSVYPEKHIQMALVLPYQRNVADRELYDEVFIPGELRNALPKDVLPARNRWLVEHSQYLIAYIRHTGNSASDALDYARSLCATIRLI